MRVCSVNLLVARWFGLAAVVALALSAGAQQSIQFTKPADQDPASKANNFLPAPASRNSPSTFNAPSPLFGDKNSDVSFDVLPGSPVPNATAAASAAQLRKILEGKKNWTLMTPEEILGIPTPEKLLGVTDPKDDPKLSAEERFLQRRDRQFAAGATNSLRRPAAAYWRDDSTKNADALRSTDSSQRMAQVLGGAIGDPTRDLKVLLDNLNQNAPAGGNRKQDSAWANPFGLPQPMPQATPEQLAGMNRFRELMEPPAPVKAVDPNRASLQIRATPSSTFQAQPLFNPIGRSFTPLDNAMGKPAGIAPLPGITGPSPVVEKKPTSLAQPPPWLSDSPSGFTPRQRQF